VHVGAALPAIVYHIGLANLAPAITRMVKPRTAWIIIVVSTLLISVLSTVVHTDLSALYYWSVHALLQRSSLAWIVNERGAALHTE
jgi:hypothetical protein